VKLCNRSVLLWAALFVACICVTGRVGQNMHIYIYGVYKVFLAGKSPNIRSYTVYIYSSGQT